MVVVGEKGFLASYACSSGRLFFNARLWRPALLVTVYLLIIAGIHALTNAFPRFFIAYFDIAG